MFVRCVIVETSNKKVEINVAKSLEEFKKVYNEEMRRFAKTVPESVIKEEYDGYLALCGLVGVVDSEIYAEKDENGTVEIFMKPIYGQTSAPC